MGDHRKGTTLRAAPDRTNRLRAPQSPHVPLANKWLQRQPATTPRTGGGPTKPNERDNPKSGLVVGDVLRASGTQIRLPEQCHSFAAGSYFCTSPPGLCPARPPRAGPAAGLPPSASLSRE